MLRKIVSVVLVVPLCASLTLAQSTAPTAASPSSLEPASDRARVFVTDSESWEMSGASGGSSAGFAGAERGGARPQTAEIIKTFSERCPEVVTNNIQAKTDYVVVLDHEGGKGYLRHRNKVAVFNRVSGDSIVSKSTLSLGGSVQDACEAITKDWGSHGKEIRAAEEAAVAAQQRPAASPVVQEVARTSAAKLSIVSNPSSADIEVDGNFVGNTPSTVELEAGDHVVKVSKTGFKAWERKLKANGGNVNINAELEAQGNP